MSVQILVGDCRDILKTLPERSIQMAVTSPPYYGLRDYGVDGQIGLEPSAEAFVAEMVAVFREVRRVLRDDGALWLNLGDSYAGSWGAQGHKITDSEDPSWRGSSIKNHPRRARNTGAIRDQGLKPKDLMGIPWMVAFALRADGWWLRQEIIWSKPNVMPESVSDRCTKAHEHLFLLTKSERYFYDAEAIMEPSSPDTHARAARGRSSDHKHADGGPGNQTIAKKSPSAGRTPGVGPKSGAGAGRLGVKANPSFEGAISGEVLPMRNKRSVWEIPTAKYSGQHFATFPPALVEPCILAGCPRGGVVLDPFGGAGTTGLVAERLGRNSIPIELNPGYAADAQCRIKADLGRASGADESFGRDPLPLFDERQAIERAAGASA